MKRDMELVRKILIKLEEKDDQSPFLPIEGYSNGKLDTIAQ